MVHVNNNYIDLNGKVILVTGAAGFIGSFLVKRLLRQFPKIKVIGLDSINGYYDIHLKHSRLKEIEELKKDFIFHKADISDKTAIDKLFADYNFDVVVNLAAQAGVRYSISNPDSYIYSNIIGFFNILEACRYHNVSHLVYASSSSVYGGNTDIPYKVSDKVDSPVSLYAATKKCDELLAYSYSKLYDIPSTGLRFFTVYGPQGRPDMAYFSFADKLCAGEKINIFNFGNCKRDFTYIDDIVEGIVRVMQCPPDKKIGDDGLPIAPYAVYNIGNSSPVNLMDFVRTLCKELIASGVLPSDFVLESHINLVPMQAGDVPVTYADVTDLEKTFGYRPSTSLEEGLRNFARWYAGYKQDMAEI